MSSQRFTTRVFHVGRQLKTKLDAKATADAWPTDGVYHEQPVIDFGDADPETGAERIGIILDVDQTSTEWVTMGPGGRDEQITFQVGCRSFIPRSSSLDLWNRLDALAAVVEGVLYDITADPPAPIRLTATGEGQETGPSRVSGVRPVVGRTPEGFIGSVFVEITLGVRI